ncbi:MAG: DUF4123 domain-containing protein [Crocinitomicaceae bacterium]|nr:DUF4123 domain-containing protein [Crocinitomicaceae bacterium]
MDNSNKSSLFTSFLIIDGARCGDELLNEAMKLQEKNVSLFDHRFDESLKPLSPYLFSFHSAELYEFYFRKGWNQSWGILIESSASLNELAQHLRKFLISPSKEREKIVFRFYDPRVLRTFIPLYNKTQLREFFGTMKYFVAEDEEKGFALRLWLENFELKKERFKVIPSDTPIPEIEKKSFVKEKSESTPSSSEKNLWID